MIFENQPDDYFNLRQDLESFLSSSPARKGVADTLPVITILLIAVNVVVFFLLHFMEEKIIAAIFCSMEQHTGNIFMKIMNTTVC